LKLTSTISESHKLIKTLKRDSGLLGIVPTMGSLHAGHISLVNRSIAENSFTAVSIFVNPTQFNEEQDFESYPRNLEDDLEILKKYQVDLVFAPPVKEIYPEQDIRVFDFGGLDLTMEGQHRPGHFNGVAQVVSKLFDILGPDKAYFGEKDFQQVAIIRKIVEDLSLPVSIIGCPIVREADGLAMSSRNKLLSVEERKSAASIPEGLAMAKSKSGKIPVSLLLDQTIRLLQQDPNLKVEYFEIVDELNLKPISSWTHNQNIRGCIAVKAGKVRLIDNMDFSF
jgi:pantoate--beta-alanine ligase